MLIELELAIAAKRSPTIKCKGDSCTSFPRSSDMRARSRYWLEYDSIALIAFLIGISVVTLIALSI